MGSILIRRPPVITLQPEFVSGHVAIRVAICRDTLT